MRKYVLLSTILLGSILAFSSNQGAFAANTSAQTVTATLATQKKITTNGGNITATIDPDTGTLSTAFNPGFTITTNTNSSQNLTLTSLCSTNTVAQNAFFGDGTASGTYIILTNAANIPAVAAVNDAKAATPTPANNAEVIAYGITPPSNITGQLIYSWDNTNKRWNAVLTHKGSTNTSVTIPAAAPKTLTFSSDDDPGPYQATIFLSFV